jgi:hypothetical protein
MASPRWVDGVATLVAVSPERQDAKSRETKAQQFEWLGYGRDRTVIGVIVGKRAGACRVERQR